MKVVCLSDSHCNLKEYIDNKLIPDGDVLIHAGDLTYTGTLSEMTKELKLLGSLPHKNKLFLCGNHDWLGEKNSTLTDEICKENGITLIHEKSVTIDGIKFYGTSYQPEFCNWAFNVPRNKMKDVWDRVPLDIKVLITHTPPWQILDWCPNGNVGCKELRLALESWKDLKLLVCGHIHSSYGVQKGITTTFANASLLDELYLPVNLPIVVDLYV